MKKNIYELVLMANEEEQDKIYGDCPVIEWGNKHYYLVPPKEQWISQLPDDKECEDWYIDNIGDDPEKPCSASSAIYKFREWLKERNQFTSYQNLVNSVKQLIKWYDDEAENNPHSAEEWSKAYEQLRELLPLYQKEI